MQTITEDKLQIAYAGPALANGQMPMEALGASLRGQALLIKRLAEILYGDDLPIRVEVDNQFERGSLIVPVYILNQYATAATDMLSGTGVTALVNLLALAGFAAKGVVSIYKLFKHCKGRKIEKTEDIPQDILNKLHIEILLLIRIYNDLEIQKQLRKVLDALHVEGVEEFQTRRNGEVIDSVSKQDILEADEVEIDDLNKDEELELDIEKCAWRKDLAWHFSDGNISFDAKIEHKSFWKQIEGGEAFSVGDRLRVHLRTRAHVTTNGRLKVERVIPTVISVEHARNRQTGLFDDTTIE